MRYSIFKEALFVLGILCFSSLAFAGVPAKLWLNMSDSFYDVGGIVWDEETNIHAGTDFELNVTNTAKDTIKNATLIISLHPDDAYSIINISIDGNVTNGSEFGYGTPGWTTCQGKYLEFPAHGIFPANYSLYAIGDLQPKESRLVTINISSTLSNPRTHYDVVGFSLNSTGDLCWAFMNPCSHDAGTNGTVPAFPGAAVPLAIVLAAPFIAYRFAVRKH